MNAFGAASRKSAVVFISDDGIPELGKESAIESIIRP